jgi:hypothetical protein
MLFGSTDRSVPPMGFNTTVLIRNDALDCIAKDPDFGKNLVSAILQVGPSPFFRTISVPALGFTNAAEVIESHHSSFEVLILASGNTARELNILPDKIKQYIVEDKLDRE